MTSIICNSVYSTINNPVTHGTVGKLSSKLLFVQNRYEKRPLLVLLGVSCTFPTLYARCTVSCTVSHKKYMYMYNVNWGYGNKGDSKELGIQEQKPSSILCVKHSHSDQDQRARKRSQLVRRSLCRAINSSWHNYSLSANMSQYGRASLV